MKNYNNESENIIDVKLFNNKKDKETLIHFWETRSEFNDFKFYINLIKKSKLQYIAIDIQDNLYIINRSNNKELSYTEAENFRSKLKQKIVLGGFSFLIIKFGINKKTLRQKFKEMVALEFGKETKKVTTRKTPTKRKVVKKVTKKRKNVKPKPGDTLVLKKGKVKLVKSKPKSVKKKNKANKEKLKTFSTSCDILSLGSN